jgi:hypothetical protein
MALFWKKLHTYLNTQQSTIDLDIAHKQSLCKSCKCSVLIVILCDLNQVRYNW